MNDLSIFLIPLACAAAALLLLPSPLASHARSNGATIVLSLLVLTALTALILSVENGRIIITDLMIVTLAMIGAILATAPLLDRARPAGIILAAPIAGLAVVSGSLNTSIFSSPALIQTIVIGAAIIGLGGSITVPLHPARYTANGQLRAQPSCGGQALSGWALMTIVIIMLGQTLASYISLLPIVIAALVAALVALLASRREDALTRAGQGLMAGVMMAMLAPTSLEIATSLGLIAAFFVVRTTVITHSLRIDDPHGITGSMLIPAMIGLLLPGILNLELLATQVIALSLSLLYGIGIAAILWPITKMVFGLALPVKALRGEA